METLKELGYTPEENVKTNIEISKSVSTHMEWFIDGLKEVEIHPVINVEMGIILAGSLQAKHFNYKGGGMDLYNLQKPFKQECLEYLKNNTELQTIEKEIDGTVYYWDFTGKTTKSNNAIFKLRK